MNEYLDSNSIYSSSHHMNELVKCHKNVSVDHYIFCAGFLFKWSMSHTTP